MIHTVLYLIILGLCLVIAWRASDDCNSSDPTTATAAMIVTVLYSVGALLAAVLVFVR